MAVPTRACGGLLGGGKGLGGAARRARVRGNAGGSREAQLSREEAHRSGVAAPLAAAGGESRPASCTSSRNWPAPRNATGGGLCGTFLDADEEHAREPMPGSSLYGVLSRT